MTLIVRMLIVVCALLAPRAVPAQEKAVTVTLFWGDGCPHCEKEKAYLRDLLRTHPTVTVREYEVWKHPENAALYKQVLKSAGIKQAGVPGTVIGGTVFMGFNDRTRAGIEAAVGRCLRDGCPDTVAGMSGGVRGAEMRGKTLSLPMFGEVDPERVSLPLFTVVIAGLDSFNPCAFFVLLFLLSLLIHAKSRPRMLFIGGVFVFFSGFIYFLFMAAWLNVFLLIGKLAVITAAGGVIALLVGGINIKDFFLLKRGVSLAIPESAKPKLYERMRGLLKAPTLPAMIAGAIVLAVTANAYELLCTAGFPMVYTRVLTLHGLQPRQYYLYLALYNLVYVVPLAVIVAAVTATLGARKLTEWQGRQLKLISGLMMASLGIILLLDPSVLNNAVASVLLLAGVTGVAWLVIVVTKKRRPEMMKQ